VISGEAANTIKWLENRLILSVFVLILKSKHDHEFMILHSSVILLHNVDFSWQ